jgi:multidrug resistance efflux pump
MSDHDIQLLTVGVAVGMELMLLVQLLFAVLDDRRARKARLAAEAKLAAAREQARA